LLGTSIGSTNAYRWIVPASVTPGTLYRIRIESIADSSLSDTSDTGFTIMNPSDVDNTNNDLLSDYNLYQNYPNPFNSTTTFKFSLTSQQFVTLKIFDVLGRELQTLVNELKTAGRYELPWNAANLTSGVYYYRLQAGDFVQTRKMILLK